MTAFHTREVYQLAGFERQAMAGYEGGLLAAYIRSGMYRNMAVYCARNFTGFTNREIGQYFGTISYSAVTKAKDRFEKVLRADLAARRTFEKIKRGISRFKG